MGLYEERLSRVSPMMRHYLETKEKYKDAILFYRLGDFYEMFFEDAETVSRELELVLTGKDCGLDERAPMCGIPYHAAQSYLGRLVSKGYKVAVCEQLEDPAKAKGIVKRDVVKIYTPGTVTDDGMIPQKSNNYMASVFGLGGFYGFAYSDVTTGEIKYTSLTVGATLTHLKDEIAKITPKEMILNADADRREEIKAYAETFAGAFVNLLPAGYYSREEAAMRMEGLGAETEGVNEWALSACGALIAYLEETQKQSLSGIFHPESYNINEFMAIDAQSRRNLEITETLRDRKRQGSLLWVMDRTETAMGARKLKKWLEQPLIDKTHIDKRLDAVDELFDRFMMRSELIDYLKGVYDIERLAGRISMGSGNARELLSLKQSLRKLPLIKDVTSDAKSELIAELRERIDTLEDLCDLLERGIAEDPPVTITDGDIIKEGYDERIDRYREANINGKKWLFDLEAREREATGIKKLKIGYNSVFGYYLEVSNSFKELVPPHYVRKQTLTNAERYITDELKKMEDEILEAERSLKNLEEQCFREIRDAAASRGEALMRTADAVAALDVLCGLASLAERENYSKPVITEDRNIVIKGGRHPVVEKMPGCDTFVPNDAVLDGGDNMLLVITGPNMAGKSTYMRQVALIALMAQTGSFVPADEASIGICDKLFTRVGASDDLARGRSTFMVEMCEVANIVANATDRSLLILDEIGRGTSTFDGLAIAWSVLEFIVTNLKSRTLFATHYHELTELQGKLSGVVNYCVDVKKKGDEITFLRKIKKGGADGSYGIAVANLAGLPKKIIIRANEILAALEEQDIGKHEIKTASRKKRSEEPDLFSFAAAAAMNDDIITELRSMDVTKMTPMECMNVLYGLVQRANDRK